MYLTSGASCRGTTAAIVAQLLDVRQEPSRGSWTNAIVSGLGG